MLPLARQSAQHVSRRFGFLLLLLALGAIALPTLYLSRGEAANANEPRPPTDNANASESAAVILHDLSVEATDKTPSFAAVEPVLPVKEQPSRREPAVEFFPQPSETEQSILSELANPADLEFPPETPLNEVQAYINDKHSNLNIQLDYKALADAGIEPSVPITRTQLNRMSLRSALRRILADLELTFVVDDDVLLITTKDKANEILVTRTYPVGDLLDVVHADSPKETSLPVRPTGGGGFGAAPGVRPSPEPTRPATVVPAEFFSVITAIQQNVAPDTWNESGGSASITPVAASKSVVISTTHGHHEEVVRLLRSLRAARQAVQASD